VEETQQIYGLDVSDSLAILTMRRFRSEWLSHEPALQFAKWFDYRFLNPVQATYLFAHEYRKAFRDAFAANFDTARAPYVKCFKHADLFQCNPQIVTGVWRARQVADAMGMPYGVYLSLAFKWNLRYWKRHTMPRPQNLYSDLVTDRAAIDWAELQTTRLYYSELPYYRNEAYCGHRSQNDHHEWLISQAFKRDNAPRALARLVQEDLLPREKVMGRLDHLTDEFLHYSNRTPLH
jgi:hypothetical protein